MHTYIRFIFDSSKQYTMCAKLTSSHKVPLITNYKLMKCKQTDTISDTTQALAFFTLPSYVTSLRL